MTPGAAATHDPMPRADAPRSDPSPRGLFAVAQSHLGGLSPQFWCLQLYLFLIVSALDEHFEATIQRVLPGALADMGPGMLLGGLTLVLALGRVVAGQDALPASVRMRPTGWLVAFVIANVFASMWAYRPAFAIDAFISHMTSVMSFALIVVIVRTRRELVLTLLSFCLGVGVFLALSWWEWRGGRYEYTMGVVRMVGAGSSYSDPNSFAATLAFSLPMLAWVFVHTARIWIRVCAVAFLALAVLAVLNTSSRSGLVLLCLACGWALWFLPRGRVKRVALVLAVLAAVTLPALLSKSQVARIESIFSTRTYTQEESTHGRVEGYVVAWKMFRERPLLGVGPGNWSEYRKARIDGNPLYPHNLGGQVLATRGAAGTLTFLGFLAATLLLGIRTLRSRKALGGVWNVAVSRLCSAMMMTYALMLVSGLGAHNLTRPNWYWCSALMLVAITCRTEDEPGPSGLSEETA